MKPADIDVLICGAGPTGLMLALRLARSGVRVRIIDMNPEQGTTSRALVVHARTLEFYRQMGLSDAFLNEGLIFTAINMWVHGKLAGHVELGEMGKGKSPFPYLMVCPQDRHERFLIKYLKEAGVEVERPTELLDFEQTTDGVRARLKRANGEEEVFEAPYLAGCDGARSRVRQVLDIGFPGGTYSHIFYVADVEATGPVMNNELHVALDDNDFILVFPLRGGTTARLVGSIEVEHESAREKLTWDDVGARIVDRMNIKVDRVNWFSTYRVHHRVANQFYNKRVFLLGDAAHIHSPAGGQGMNTGIGDAVNLAWKLADVIQGKAKASLLDSYEPERIAFARRLVATTDQAFVVVTDPRWWIQFIRRRIVPIVFPIISAFQFVRRYIFKTVSQTIITYRGSAISAGSVGTVSGGDRLPWVEWHSSKTADNYEFLDGIHWQVHVYGTAKPEIIETCKKWDLHFHEYQWKERMGRVGLTQNAIYLIRPDGHVAFVDGGTSVAPLAGYLQSIRG